MKQTDNIIRPDFLIIPGPVAFCDDLQPLDQRLYGVVYWLHSLKDGKCTASNLYLAKICYPNEKDAKKLKIRARSIQNALTRLEGVGFVKRTYRDAKQKVRSSIVPLVEYRVSSANSQNISSNDDTVSSKNDTYVSSNDDQIRNISKSKSRKDIAAASAAPLSGQKQKCGHDGCGKDTADGKRYCNDHTPMDLPKFVDWCKKSSSPHVRLIGEWAEAVGQDFGMVSEWNEYIKRYARIATRICSYSRDRIDKAFDEIQEDIKAGWLKDYSMETLYKKINNAKAK
jgi:hypothetical protein